MAQGSAELEKIVGYMRAHWPSEVRSEWQVGLGEYPEICRRVLADLVVGASRERNLVRIAGLSGSGKTTQLLPAVEGYFEGRGLSPVLVAARRFAPYHPHYEEILDFYGETSVRKKTDEFSTIMMFMVLRALIREGYDMILDVTLLDPAMEEILVGMMGVAQYRHFLTMIAAAPEVTEKHLGARAWRHSRETELEFIRATELALKFYADKCPEMRAVIWDVFSEAPVFDGKISEGGVEVFEKFSKVTEIPEHDEEALRQAKIKYFTTG